MKPISHVRGDQLELRGRDDAAGKPVELTGYTVWPQVRRRFRRRDRGADRQAGRGHRPKFAGPARKRHAGRPGIPLRRRVHGGRRPPDLVAAFPSRARRTRKASRVTTYRMQGLRQAVHRPQGHALGGKPRPASPVAPGDSPDDVQQEGHQQLISFTGVRGGRSTIGAGMFPRASWRFRPMQWLYPRSPPWSSRRLRPCQRRRREQRRSHSAGSSWSWQASPSALPRRSTKRD